MVAVKPDSVFVGKRNPAQFFAGAGGVSENNLLLVSSGTVQFLVGTIWAPAREYNGFRGLQAAFDQRI